jgi:tetratricopeptide (TPR) repeat protein
LTSYDRALTVQPNHSGTHNNRGNALTELQRFGEAVESFDRALALNPCNLDALVNRGTALKALLRFDEAEASLTAALNIQPANPIALFNLGSVLELQNRGQEAIRYYERTLAIKPDMVAARLALCLAECRSFTRKQRRCRGVGLPTRSAFGSCATMSNAEQWTTILSKLLDCGNRFTLPTKARTIANCRTSMDRWFAKPWQSVIHPIRRSLPYPVTNL